MKKQEIYIWCDPEILKICRWKKIKVIEISQCLLDDMFFPHLVAKVSLQDIEKITEEECKSTSAWWRSVGEAWISEDQKGMHGRGYKPRVMREVGLLKYICDQYSLSTERNVAAVIGTFAKWEGKDPIALFNSIKKL